MKNHNSQQNVTTLEFSPVHEYQTLKNRPTRKNKIIIICIISLIVTVCIITAIVLWVILSKPRPSNLKKVIVIARHGARTSFYSIPVEIVPDWKCDLPQKISYEMQLMLLNTTSPTPCPPGELVKNGYLQHKELSQRLKRQYINTKFVAADYDNSQIRLRSTNTTRTRASLLGQLSILFPNQDQFDVEMADNLNDGYHPPFPCAWQSAFQDQIYKTHASKFPMKQELDKVNSALKTNNLDWNKIWDALRAITGRGDQLPIQISQDTYQQVEIANNMFWRQWFCNENTINSTKIVQINIGPIFNDIIQKMTQDAHKLNIITAHDTVVAPLMTVLTNSNWDCNQPKFAADIAIELDQQDQISIKYNGQKVTTLNCASKTSCTLQEFIELLTPYAVSGQARIDLCNVKFN